MKKTINIALLSLLAGCSSYSGVSSVVLPSSNEKIDIVLHRSDVRFSDCGTLTVLQTYNMNAALIDSKEARGQALHCTLLPALIDAGGRVGAGAVVRPARTTISNAVNAAAGAVSGSSSSATGGSATATGVGGSGIGIGVGGAGGNGGAGGAGGQGGQGSNGEHGNNGGGNGDGDGTNSGTDHHHDNGDNS